MCTYVHIVLVQLMALRSSKVGTTVETSCTSIGFCRDRKCTQLMSQEKNVKISCRWTILGWTVRWQHTVWPPMLISYWKLGRSTSTSVQWRKICILQYKCPSWSLYTAIRGAKTPETRSPTGDSKSHYGAAAIMRELIGWSTYKEANVYGNCQQLGHIIKFSQLPHR